MKNIKIKSKKCKISVLLCIAMIIQLFPITAKKAEAETLKTYISGQYTYDTSSHEYKKNGTAITLNTGDTIQIGTTTEMDALADYTNNDGNTVGINWVLTNDIIYGYWQDKDYDGVTDDNEIYDALEGGNIITASNYTTIGLNNKYSNNEKIFKGNFDGKGHVLSGIYYENDDYSFGIFGAAKNGTISNVGLKETVTKTYISAGILADGSNEKVIGCYNEANLSATHIAVGIVGKCSSASQIFNCYNTAKLSGSYTKGICDTVNDDSTIINCYNTGQVRYGIAGQSDNKGIWYCYYTTESALENCGNDLELDAWSADDGYHIKAIPSANVAVTSLQNTCKFDDITDSTPLIDALNAGSRYMNAGVWKLENGHPVLDYGNTQIASSKIKYEDGALKLDIDYGNQTDHNPDIEWYRLDDRKSDISVDGIGIIELDSETNPYGSIDGYMYQTPSYNSMNTIKINVKQGDVVSLGVYNARMFEMHLQLNGTNIYDMDYDFMDEYEDEIEISEDGELSIGIDSFETVICIGKYKKTKIANSKTFNLEYPENNIYECHVKFDSGCTLTSQIMLDSNGGETTQYAPDSSNMSVWGKVLPVTTQNPPDDGIFCVVIQWGILKYDYSSGNWDATQYKYTGVGWSPVNSGTSDKFTIINKSTVGITADFSYANAGGRFGSLNGDFYKEAAYTTDYHTFDLDAINTETGAIDLDSNYLKVDGTPSDLTETTDYVNIGTVTVTISQN